MKVFKISKAPALECCSLLNASYATFIWKQRPVRKQWVWEERGYQEQDDWSNTIIPQQSQLLQWSQTQPSSSGKIKHTQFHKDNTPFRELLKQPSFTQGCRKPWFKVSLLQLLFQHYRKTEHWLTNQCSNSTGIPIYVLSRKEYQGFSNELWGAKS